MPPMQIKTQVVPSAQEITSSSHVSLKPAQKAAQYQVQAEQAMISRLLTCLVNEGMIHALFIRRSQAPAQVQASNIADNFCQIVPINQNGERIDDVEGTFFIGLKGMPLVFKEHDEFRVKLLDPEDFEFPVLFKLTNENEVETVQDARVLMKWLTIWRNLDQDIVSKVTSELLSCVEHQTHAYIRRKPLPKMGDSSIMWEQSIVEGHPTHPMNKARHALPPIAPLNPEDDLLNPDIYLFAVPKNKVTIHGRYQELIQPLLEGLDLDSENETVVPVHETQIPNIYEKFPFARKLNKAFPSKAQAALRTIVLDDMPELNLKLAVGIKVSSALRTITPWTTHVGPHFMPVANKVVDDKDNLIVIDEVGSIVSNHEDPDVAKHLSCLLRDDPEVLCAPRGEVPILAAALTEKLESGDYALTQALGLNTVDQRLAFFKTYAKSYLKAFATPVYKYGLTFESHLQNVLARFKLNPTTNNYDLTGFMIRDFGGIKVDQKKLFATTGMKVNVWNTEACQIAKSSEDMHLVAYHTMIQMHLHRVIRALNLHHDQSGWKIVRDELDQLLPADCDTRKLWLESETSEFKSFIKMKLDGLYRDYLYAEVPNHIVYQPPTELTSQELETEVLNR